MPLPNPQNATSPWQRGIVPSPYQNQPQAASGVWPGNSAGSYNKGVIGTIYDAASNSYKPNSVDKATQAGSALKALQESSGLNLLGSANGFGNGFGGAGGAGGGVPHVGVPDNTAANAAVFARAKDTAGQNSRAALESLRGQMSERGMLGSGIEGGNTARIVGQEAGGLGDLNREQAIQDVNRNNQFAQMGYQGDVTQRGQDLTLEGQRRALLAQQQSQMMQGLLGVIDSSGMLY